MRARIGKARWWGTALTALVALGCGGGDGGEDPDRTIRIRIDSLGIPHVSAATDEDLFYGYGYQLASDRMLQLEMWRRFAFGRRAEVLGSGAPGAFGATALQDDQLVRMFDVPRWGRADAALMRAEDPEHWRLLQAWREGINARVDEIRDGVVPRPFGFREDELDFLPERWDEDDPVVVQKMIHLGLDQTILYEILVSLLGQMAPDALAAVQLFRPAREVWQVPPEDLPAGAGRRRAPARGAAMDPRARAVVTEPHGPSAGGPARPATPERLDLDALRALLDALPGARRPGSNSWAVDGRHTEDGRPLLAGDPHLVFTLMGCMHALHLDSRSRGGSFDVAGFSFVPAMGIFAGQTREVAFTPTSAFGDVMDLWGVVLDGETARIGGREVPIEFRDEVIRDRSGTEFPITYRDVPGYGVVFEGSFSGVPIPVAGPGREAVIGWTGFTARSSRYFWGLNRVTSVDEFDREVLRIPEMSYNWLAADARGITYRVSLEVPARHPVAPGREPWRVMNGDDPLALWPGGKLPVEQLPSGRARERGFLVTANNDPFGFTRDGDPGNDPWYYGAFFDPGYRAGRIEAELLRLTARGGVTLAEVQALQMDVHSGMADDLAPLLLEAWAARETETELAEFRGRDDLATLVALITEPARWNRRMARAEAGALAFHAFAHFLAGQTLEDDILSVIYERALTEAPFFVIKIAIQALRGDFPDGARVVQAGAHRVILQALDATAAFLAERFGGVDPTGYRYGDLRVSDLDNAFGLGMPIRQVPTDGGEDTVNVGHGVFRRNGRVAERWVSDYGPVERMTARFREDGTPELWVNFLLGNVADPASPHFDDALDDWVEGRYRRFPFTEAEVAAATERTHEFVR